MDLNFFNKLRILDGGMGQQLLAKGLISKGTLWSATANLDKNFHDLVVNVHLSFINAGSEVILTNTFQTTYFSKTLRFVVVIVTQPCDFLSKMDVSK